MSWIDNAREVILTPEVAGTAGAVVSLKWLPIGSTWKNKASSFFGGLCVAFFLVPYLLETMGVKSTAAVGAFGFLGGVFGMLLLSRAWDYIATTPLGELLTSLITRKPQ